jgi:hypothetical protein
MSKLDQQFWNSYVLTIKIKGASENITEQETNSWLKGKTSLPLILR